MAYQSRAVFLLVVAVPAVAADPASSIRADIEVRLHSGNALLERARLRAADGEQREARAIYEQANSAFEQAQREVGEEALPFRALLPRAPDAATTALRDQLRADLLQTQLLIALTKEEIADTYSADEPTRNKLLADAGELFGDIFRKYPNRIAGRYARFYQARTLQKLGRHRIALDLLKDDLLSLPQDLPELRKLRIQAVTLAIPSWKIRGETAAAVSAGLISIDAAPETEKYSNEYQGLRYHVAQAVADYCAELHQRMPRDDEEIGRLKKLGIKLCIDVLKSPNDWRDQARNLLPPIP